MAAKIRKKGLLFFCVPAAERARREHVNAHDNQRDGGRHCLVAGYDERGGEGDIAAQRMSAWVDSVGDIDDIDGYEHTGQNDLNIGVVFDFYCIEQVEPDVAKMQWRP